MQPKGYERIDALEQLPLTSAGGEFGGPLHTPFAWAGDILNTK